MEPGNNPPIDHKAQLGSELKSSSRLHHLAPGTVVNDQYQIVEKLGEGAMGAVLLASDLSLDRYVALKVLKGDVSMQLDGNARFAREARLLSQLSHPNLVTIHAYGTVSTRGAHFIVMEYVPGQSMESHLDEHGPLPPAIFCHVLRQIGNAMAAAHERGIVHRDLKPANVLITSVAGDEHFVKVVDFGLATMRRGVPNPDGELTEDGLTVGTPAYISPEQAQNENVDIRSDIYTLAVTACHMLTGHLPFEKESAVALLVAHVMETPELPSVLAPELGLERGGPIDTVLKRALSKSPDERQPDVRTFVDELIAAVTEWQRDSTGLDIPAMSDVEDAPQDRQRGPQPAFPPSLSTSVDLVGIDSRENAAPVARQLAALYLQFDALTGSADDDGPTGEVIECLAVVAARVQAAIREHGGWMSGTLSDRLVALFGMDAGEPRAEGAVMAALSVRNVLRSLEDDPTMPPEFSLPCRLGVDVGPVLVGELGGLGALLQGRAVFSARQLARRGLQGQVRISQGAYRHVRGVFDMDAVRARGAGKSWVVSGRKPVVRRPGQANLHGVAISLIGRHRELAALRHGLDEATATGSLRAVLLTGPPGVGRTRLMSAFTEETEEREESYFLEMGRCTSSGSRRPYEPFVNALKTRAGLEESDTDDQVRMKIQHFVQRFLAVDPTAPAEGDRRFEWLLAELFNIALPLSALEDDDDVTGESARRGRLFERIGALYRRLASRHPLIFLIDDLQWASDGTRALLGSLMGHLADVPVLFVVATRAEGWEASSATLLRESADVKQVAVKPLSVRDTERLVAHTLRRLAEVPKGLVDQICELAQGSPLIVEETVHDLIDDGVLVVEGEVWRLKTKKLRRLRLPGTVKQLLSARIRKVPVTVRGALEVAAVAGRRFWPAMLHELVTGEGTTPVPVAIAELERRGFVRVRGEMKLGGENDYTFAQVAMREAVYEDIPKRQRTQIHLDVARWLERNAGAGAGRLDDEMGYHFQEGGAHLAALKHRWEAASQAKKMYALADAIEHLSGCLELCPLSKTHLGSGEQRHWLADVQAELAEVLALSGDLNESVEVSAAALSSPGPEGRDRGPWLARVATGHGWTLAFMGRYGEAEAAFTSALEELSKLDDPALLLRARTGAAATQAKLGDAADAASAIRRAIQHHQRRAHGRRGAEADLSVSYRVLGNCEVWRGDYVKGRQAYRTAYDLAISANAPEHIVDALNGLAATFYYQGAPDEAESRWQQALETAERWDLMQHRVVLLGNLGELAVSRGDHAAAVMLCERAESLGRFLGADEALADAHRIHASALLAKGTLREAEVQARSALERAEELGSPHSVGPAHRTLAQVLGERRRKREGRRVAASTVARHLDAAVEAFELAGMNAEVDATMAIAADLRGESTTQKTVTRPDVSGTET